MFSIINFVVPYGFVVPPIGLLSVKGSVFGVPYTVADDEKTKFLQLCARITSIRTNVEIRLLS